MRLKRRTFLSRSAALASAGALPFVFVGRRAQAADYGPLLPDPDAILDLPQGFSYAVVERAFETMSDGYRVPGKPDGMACFTGQNGTLVLLRNHELTGSRSEGPYQDGQAPPAEAYDPDSYGGVTRLVVDAVTYERRSSNLVLTGTAQNCAGGPSPWGWLSCEEAFDDEHGYVFVCPAAASSVQVPQRIVGYGHFRHEAVAIETPSNRAYLTEDRPDSCLYRFVPDDPAAPFAGKLQALGISGRPGLDTANGLEVGDELDVTWIDLDDPDPASDTLRATAIGDGAAVIRRGEGIRYDDGVVYFDSTSGGPVGLGQIFALRPTAAGGTLTLIAQSTGETTLNGPDNIALSPWGDLLIAEDSLSGNGVHYLRGLTPEGELYDLARTTQSELAGICASPDGRALFVNVYGAGLTLVITGPFPAIDSGGSGAGGQGGETSEPGASGQAGADISEDAGGAAGEQAGNGGAPDAPGGNAGTGGSNGAGRGGTPAGSAGASAASAGAAPAGGGTTGVTGGASGNGRSGASGGGGMNSAGSAGAGKAGALGTGATNDDSGDCSCRTGPGAARSNAAGLTAFAGLLAAWFRRSKNTEGER